MCYKFARVATLLDAISNRPRRAIPIAAIHEWHRGERGN